MNDLAQTALTFARECMGWERPALHGEGHWEDGKPFVLERDGHDEFDYTDLNAVMTAVHTWCKAHYCQWAVFGNSRHEKFEYLAFILPFDDFWEARCDTAPSPQYALMAACVEAVRKLKD